MSLKAKYIACLHCIMFVHTLCRPSIPSLQGADHLDGLCFCFLCRPDLKAVGSSRQAQQTAAAQAQAHAQAQAQKSAQQQQQQAAAARQQAALEQQQREQQQRAQQAAAVAAAQAQQQASSQVRLRFFTFSGIYLFVRTRSIIVFVYNISFSNPRAKFVPSNTDGNKPLRLSMPLTHVNGATRRFSETSPNEMTSC